MRARVRSVMAAEVVAPVSSAPDSSAIVAKAGSKSAKANPPRSRRLSRVGPQASNTITDRATAPRFISSKASLICSRAILREIIWSSFNCPRK